MEPAYIRIVEARRARLDGLSKLLSSVSYHQVLARGFALVTDAQGNLVRASSDVKPGDALTIDVAQGSIAATVAGAPSIPKRKARSDDEPGTQESLF
jgi:exodeoxyribonuclease VII large subunit